MLVLGAYGDQGIPLVSALLEQNVNVVAGARRGDAMQNTPHSDIEVLAADISDQASLETAFAQVDAVAMHLPFEHNVEVAEAFGRNIAGAAKKVGLRKLVFNTSCYVVDDQDLGLGGHEGRQRIEKTIKQSGVDYVILRPAVFMDNQIRAWCKPAVVHQNTFAYPASDELKISWISLDDLGKLVACATMADNVSKQTITVGGPQALTGHQIAANMSQAAGREIVFKSLAPMEFAENMSELVTGSREVIEGSVYWGMSRFYGWYNEQAVSPLDINPQGFKDILPVTLTSHAEWAKRQDWDKV